VLRTARQLLASIVGYNSKKRDKPKIFKSRHNQKVKYMKKAKIIFVSAVMLITPFLYQCQKGDLDKTETSKDYLSNDYIINLETLSGFYSVAIHNTKLKSSLKSSELIISDIENQVAQMCSEKFGGEFDTEYTKLKDLTDLKRLKSTKIEEYPFSDYAKNLYFEIEENIDSLFNEESTPSNEEMQAAITNKLMFYQGQIADDVILSVDEKTYLINSIQSQIIMLPTTFDVADLLFQNIDDETQSAMLKKGWLKKKWKKVSRFVGVVAEYGMIGYLAGNEIGGIAGLAIGLGAAIYCENEGYDHCVCSPVYCFLGAL